MPTMFTPRHLLRLLGIFALPVALLAALMPGSAALAGVQQGTTVSSDFQIYLCLTGYAGLDYLSDCTVSGAGDFSVTLTDTLVGGSETIVTDGNGTVSFDRYAGDYTATLEVPGDFASFYYSCFDGNDVFYKDGFVNLIDFTYGTGSTSFCRWYVIPEDASGPSPSAAPSVPAQGTASADFQVYTCPVAYRGGEYLTDCDPIVDPVDVLLSPVVPFDGNDFERAPTGDEGRVAFIDLLAADYSAAVDIPGEFADFYVACFDVTSGFEEFLFDGDTNTVSFDLSDDSGISCRFYVIPEDLSGQSASPSGSATVAPSVAPTASPRSSVGGSAINVLPSTGTGSGVGSSSISILLAGLAILAVAAVAVAARRMSGAGR